MEIYINDTTKHNLETYKEIFFSLLDKTKEVLKLKNEFTLSLTIVSTRKIHQLNKEFRNIDRPTDVISFAFLDDKTENIIYSDSLTPIDLGEIYICYNVCKRNAIKYGNSFDREFSFLFVHGLLHLLGYDHQNKKDEEIMFSLQDIILPPKEA